MILKSRLLKNPYFVKDFFSSQASQYKIFRPKYPEKIFRYLISECRDRRVAWDAGTGNGQSAKKLSSYFEKVYATDISNYQILNAFQGKNISYSVANEQAPFLKRRSVDLITVAQSLHWFDTEIFYAEAKRLLKRYGLIACWSYNLFRIDENINREIDWLYHDFLKEFWPPQKRLVETGYRSLPFPFRELRVPKFEIDLIWNFENMLGYLNSWSGVINFEKRKGFNPILKNIDRLKFAWGDTEENKKVKWLISIRAGHLF